MNWTLPAILRATGGELLQWGAGPFVGISTDSRQANRGHVFLALAGDRFDAHEFLPKVVAQGATGVIVSRPVAPPARGVAWMRVAEGLRALGDLAAARRRELRARFVGVTGSNGKTTTKEMIAAVLAGGGKVAKSSGTENNLVGLPKSILALEGDEDFVVLEMGMNRPGEIWRLAEIADPDVGVITNVGPAHLEGLGSLENVAASKGELALAMSAHSTLVVNGRDRLLVPIAGAFPGRKVLIGLDAPVALRGFEPEGNTPGQRLTLAIGGKTVIPRLALAGEHNAWNATIAAAVGFVLGLDAEAIAGGLERFVPPPMRLERLELASGAVLVNDAYNANPASMAAALAVLAGETAKRRIAVLGHMRELGAESTRWHREVGTVAATKRVDLLVAVGDEASGIADGALAAGLDAARIVRTPTTAEAAARLRDILAEGDVVLVKASRGAGLEDVVERLRGAGH